MKVFITLAFLFGSIAGFHAQYGDCNNNVDACTNPSFSVTPSGFGNVEEFTTGSISNPSSNPNASPGNSGCLLSGELNSTWLFINVTGNGTLEFSMGGAGTSGNCFDWIMWEYDATACSDISSNSLPPVACNWNGACNGITGMANAGNLPSGGDPTDFEHGLNVTAGDQFVLCFSNYSSASTNVPLNFFGTATVTCGSVSNPTICYGETAWIAVYDGVSYVWDSSTPGFIGTNAAGDTAFVNPTVTTDYDVTITMGNGTTQVATSTVTVLPQITISATPTLETCLGDGNGSLSFSTTNGVAPITYSLSGASTASNTTGNFSNLPSGSYTMDITDANGCMSTLATTLDPGPACCALVLSTINTNNPCFGSCIATVTLDTTGTTGVAPIQWYDGNNNPIAGANGLTMNGLCAGTYTAEVADPACTLTTSVVITEPALFGITVTPTNETCQGDNDGQIQVTPANGATPINYTLSGASSASNTTGIFTNLPDGNYNMSATDANGCTATGTAAIAAGPVCCSMVLSTLQTNNVCFNECLGTATVDTTGMIGAGTIQWFDALGNPIAGATGLTASNLCAGTYTVDVTDQACTLTESVTITQPTDLSYTVTPTNLTCFNNNSGSLVLVASGGTAPYQYSIDNGISFSTNGNFTGLTASTYDITVIDNNGCVETGQMVLSEPTELLVTVVVVDNTCNQGNASCDGSITATPSGGNAPYSYSWSSGILGIPNPTAICAGFYDLTVTDENGCSVTNLNIEVAEPGEVTIDLLNGLDPLCFNDCNGSIEITSTNATIFSIDGGTTTSGTNLFEDLCSGSYNIYVSDANGCHTSVNTSLSNPGAVEAFYLFGPQPTTIYNSEVTYINQSVNATSVYWYYMVGNDTLNVFTDNPTIAFPEDAPGTYTVCLVASNQNQCMDTLCMETIIDDEFFLFVPNAFSPNGDDNNDIFYPVINNYDETSFELFLFNRWGQVIFKSESPNSGWDGNHMNTPAEEGVYVWKINVRSKTDGKKQSYTGHVSLLR